MFRLFIVVLSVTGLMLSAGFTYAVEKEPLRVAVIDPFHGPAASIGEAFMAHFKLETDRINSEGGINGHQIELVPYDNSLSPQKSLVQLEKAINEGIQYIAHGGGDAVASALLNAIDRHNRRNPDNRVLYLNHSANGAVFTNEQCSFWHFLFDSHTGMKMNILTDWIATQEDIETVYLLNQDYDFGRAVSRYAREMLEQKRPDIEVVGDIFVPLAQVKDFTPYVTEIKASGTDVIITGNWGSDMTLLVKAAASVGLETPFLTYYANSPGVINTIGKQGVDRVYLVSEITGDFDDPELASRQVESYNNTGYDYMALRVSNTFNMLKLAAEKADSIKPIDVAFALEGLTYDSPTGRVTMRAEDHQVQQPMFISVLKDNMTYGASGTDLNFHELARLSAADGEMETTCQMRRPDR